MNAPADAPPAPGREMLEFLHPENPISLFELLHLVTPAMQIIDGEFTARLGTKFFLRIAAIDSSAWEIETTSRKVIAILRKRYPFIFEIDAALTLNQGRYGNDTNQN